MTVESLLSEVKMVPSLPQQQRLKAHEEAGFGDIFGGIAQGNAMTREKMYEVLQSAEGHDACQNNKRQQNFNESNDCELKTEMAALRQENARVHMENVNLKSLVEQLRLQIAQLDGATLAQNESLLLKILDSGSGDTMSMIFNKVTSLREKVCLERVCRSFRKHSRTFQAWANIKSVEIRDVSYIFENSDYWINNDIISEHYIISAIESILHRTRNIRSIKLYSCKRLTPFSLVARSIKEQGTGTYQKVQQLVLSGWKSPALSLNILVLIKALKSQLKCLELVNICFSGIIDMKRLWKCVGESVNLESFTYITDLDGVGSYSDCLISPEMIKTALRGKTIRFINLLMPCMTNVHFLDIVSSLSDPLSLQHLTCYSYLSLADFALHLPVTLDNLKKIDFSCWGSLTKMHRDWSVILRLPYLSSQLRTLAIGHVGTGLDVDQAIELIVSYVTILNERERAVDFQLRLFSKAFCDTDWSLVKESLVNYHGFQIEPPSCYVGSSFRVRCGKESRLSIEI